MNIKDLLTVGKKKNRCHCHLCNGNREIKAILRRGDVREMRKCIRDLSDLLCNSGEELSMANAYIDDLKTKQSAAL